MSSQLINLNLPQTLSLRIDCKVVFNLRPKMNSIKMLLEPKVRHRLASLHHRVLGVGLVVHPGLLELVRTLLHEDVGAFCHGVSRLLSDVIDEVFSIL